MAEEAEEFNLVFSSKSVMQDTSDQTPDDDTRFFNENHCFLVWLHLHFFHFVNLQPNSLRNLPPLLLGSTLIFFFSALVRELLLEVRQSCNDDDYKIEDDKEIRTSQSSLERDRSIDEGASKSPYGNCFWPTSTEMNWPLLHKLKMVKEDFWK
uniref:Uncharacterized protein n=1 Tax=Nelumbo nucifera TaxID=4432 RepID=A0A822Z5Z7_NELNU|nr:TPA_asm: hypothetical protein HUJ06_014353 [Nelumbo nucifera]